MTDTALAVITPEDAALAAHAAITGDLGKLSPDQLTQLYGGICRSMGLNPLTRPFELLILNGKKTLYAAKNCAEQLRRINRVNVTSVKQEVVEGVLMVTVQVSDASGRTDMEMGAVPIKGLTGENLANAYMKALTKAKRRATLSICGLGFLDETEVGTIQGARVEPVDDAVIQNAASVTVEQVEPADMALKAAKRKVWTLAKGYGWNEQQFAEAIYALTGKEPGGLNVEELGEVYAELDQLPEDACQAIAGGAPVESVIVR